MVEQFLSPSSWIILEDVLIISESFVMEKKESYFFPLTHQTVIYLTNENKNTC